MTEAQLRSILNKEKQEKSQYEKRVLQFEDLRNAMTEFGVPVRRPPFLEDQFVNKYKVDGLKLQQPMPKDEENDDSGLTQHQKFLIQGNKK